MRQVILLILVTLLFWVLVLDGRCANPSSDPYQVSIDLREKGKFKEALQYLDETIKAKPGFYQAFVHRGLCYYKLEMYNRALADLDRAIALEANDATAYYLRARCRLEMGNSDDAFKDADKAVGLGHGGDAFFLRANILEMQGKAQKAINDYGQAIAAEPKNAGRYFSRGALYFRLGKYQLAVDDLSHVIALKNSGSLQSSVVEKAYRLRLQAYEKLGKSDLAAGDRKILEDMDRDSRGLF